ncbi:fungal-specific transcription factor domain-containing protein [Plectosphaerella plurivora]|uniref:Fungal-specific transcription factor domain-containing protein n=1 Tax=Plectosphaerella plurivora TaxID=936078 RepID=A0A9P8VG25_9PEZI|nr:fungal-specific transcription factor domain-containing protein [Plectosphaerella plurivora]
MMGESSAAAKRRQRRIPDEFRKRNAQSCDHCRKRRCRCVAATSGQGCVACQEHNVTCTFTAPRKTRFYGSVDDLSDRYRCLEAIVKGAFPGDQLTTTADLVQLGRRMGYTMPDLAEPNRTIISIEDLVRTPDSLGASNGTTRAGSHQPGDTHMSPAASDQGTAVTRNSDAHAVTTTVDDMTPSTDDAHLSLIRDTSGNEHYIGPSGTLNFLSQLRRLIVSSHVAPDMARSERVTKFTQDDTAQALEADDSHEQQEALQRQGGNGAQGPTQGPNDISTSHDSPGSMTSSIARDFTRMPMVDLDETLRRLPPDDVLETLIHAYFKNVHDDFPLFHRATFEDEYELYVVQARRGRPPLSAPLHASAPRPVPDWGWVGCLHMILVFGSIAHPSAPGVDHMQLRRASVAAARTLLPQFISKCTLSNVRVLLLLALFLHNNNERNASWNLVGTATRIAFALGLHRGDMGSSFRPLEREVRKWVFCTLYGFEQFLASSLGRPSGLQEMDVEVVPPREGFLDGSSGTDAALVSMSLRLQCILARTRFTYARLPRPDGTASPATAPPKPTIEDILRDLTSWRHEVSKIHALNLPTIRTSVPICGSAESPSAMNFEDIKVSLSWKTRAQLRAVVLLHIQCHYIAIVATRPVLLREIAEAQKTAGGAAPAADMSPVADICLYHACQLTYLVLLLDSFQLMNGLSALDVFYAYCAAMILILRLLRRQVSPEEHSKEARIQALIKDLVLKSQKVINSTEKSGSMRRFAKVVDAFAECTSQTGQRFESSTARQAANVSWPRNFPPGLPPPGVGFVTQAPPSMATMAPPQGMMGVVPEAPIQVGVPTNLWPLATFGAPGVQLDDGGYYFGPFGGGEPAAAPEWVDMETVLASYGIP